MAVTIAMIRSGRVPVMVGIVAHPGAGARAEGLQWGAGYHRVGGLREVWKMRSIWISLSRTRYGTM